MWMNEHEIEDAARQFAEHTVLGPATATLQGLVTWTNANSDGWPYWAKPAKAASGIMELVQQGVKHEREAYQLPRTPEPTAAQYKAALVPLKSFRTRMGKTPLALGAHEHGELFPIYDALPEGKSGRTFAAELAYAEAASLHEAAEKREKAALALRRLAGGALAESRQVDHGHAVLAQLQDEQAAERIIRLATPGTRVWLLPDFIGGRGGHYDGTGHFAESLGMTGPTDDHLVVVKDTENDKPYNWLRLKPYVVLLPGEAAAKWWVVDGAGNLVTGGHDDRERMLELAAKQAEPCKVVQGAEFVPGAGDVLAAGSDCDECQASIPDAEPDMLSRHHWPSCSLYPESVAEVSS